MAVRSKFKYPKDFYKQLLEKYGNKSLNSTLTFLGYEQPTEKRKESN